MVLICDASDKGLGACLALIYDGVEKPIAYISRALSPSEQRYSTTGKVSLSCVWACERLHFYLYECKFVLHTDHRTL